MAINNRFYVGAVNVENSEYAKATLEEAINAARSKVRADGEQRVVVQIVKVVRKVLPAVEVVEVEDAE
jgi:fructose/tagatose bisphosphate aldolase